MSTLQDLVDELEDATVHDVGYGGIPEDVRVRQAARKAVEERVVALEQKLKEAAKLAEDYLALNSQNAGLREKVTELQKKLSGATHYSRNFNMAGYSGLYSGDTYPCNVTLSSRDNFWFSPEADKHTKDQNK